MRKYNLVVCGGGLTGVATVLNYLFGFPVGLTSMLMNVPLFLMGYRLMGGTFAFRSLIAMVLFPNIISNTVTAIANILFTHSFKKDLFTLDNKVTGNLRLWRDMQEQLRRGVQPEFKVPTFDDLLRSWRAEIARGKVPGIIPLNQWECLKWLGNSSQYTTSRRNRRFVVERTAQSWDTLAEMTETIASARANPSR